MNNTLAIDMINLDHTYLCYNGEIFDNNKRRRGNIRPAFYDNRIDINDNTFRELITYHTNHTQYCYESLLAMYIAKYITEVESKFDTVHTVVFTVPHIFNKDILDCVMTRPIVDNYRFVYDYEAASNVCKDDNTVIIVPSEFETTVIVNNVVTVIPFGSHNIKTAIKNFVPFDISLNDAWTLYEQLQMLPKVNTSIVLSSDQSFNITREDLSQLFASYYNALRECVDNNKNIAPFRWLSRDIFVNHMFDHIIRTYNPDEAICIAACNMKRSNNFVDTFKYVDTYKPSVKQLNDDCKKISDQVCFNSVLCDYLNHVDKMLITNEIDIQFDKINEDVLLLILDTLANINYSECQSKNIRDLTEIIRVYLQEHNLQEVKITK